MRAGQRLGHKTAAQATQQGLEFVAHVGHRQHVLPGQQVDGHWRHALRGIGDGDRAVVHQLIVADRFSRGREGVVWRDAKNKGQRTQRPQLHTARVGVHARHPDRQVDLPRHQRLPGAGHDVAAQPQTGCRALGLVLIADADAAERLDQVKNRRCAEQVFEADRQRRFPAAGDPLDAVGYRVELLQQAPAFVQQLGAGGGELRLPRAAVEEQHIERFFELAHAVGQRRRHLAELARGGGKTAGAGDGVHHRQGVGGQDIAAVGHRLFCGRWSSKSLNSVVRSGVRSQWATR